MHNMSLSPFPSLAAARRAGTLAVLGLALGWSQAMAQAHDPSDHAGHGAAATVPAAVAGALTEGEITRRDARSGKLTIRHGEIVHLAMPPMTMVFALQQPSQADALQPGDKVRFQVEKVNGALLITHIEAVAPRS
jgi:Cu/Ag efflux protein CusF